MGVKGWSLRNSFTEVRHSSTDRPRRVIQLQVGLLGTVIVNESGDVGFPSAPPTDAVSGTLQSPVPLLL